MKFDREFAVGLLEFVGTGVTGNAQNLIIVTFVGHRRKVEEEGS